MNKRVFKFRVYDEKYRSWCMNERFGFYTGNEMLQNGFIFQQYVGMQDIYGKDIYEGDIIEYTEKMDDHGDKQTLRADVMYSAENAAFMLGRNNLVWNYLDDACIYDLKVVGNIFEREQK